MGKDTIKKWILSHLSIGKRGFKSKFDFTIIILLIFKRLKQVVSGGNFLNKMAKTTNSIFFSDNLGQILAFGSPKSGNHHNLNDIETILEEILALLEEVKNDHKGLFLNADAGFDSKKIRKILNDKEIIGNIPKNPRNGENFDDDFFIFDEELHKNRFKIERSFAWLDGFKGLIMRYETLNTTWCAMLYLGLIVNFMKKV